MQIFYGTNRQSGTTPAGGVRRLSHLLQRRDRHPDDRGAWYADIDAAGQDPTGELALGAHAAGPRRATARPSAPRWPTPTTWWDAFSIMWGWSRAPGDARQVRRGKQQGLGQLHPSRPGRDYSAARGRRGHLGPTRPRRVLGRAFEQVSVRQQEDRQGQVHGGARDKFGGPGKGEAEVPTPISSSTYLLQGRGHREEEQPRAGFDSGQTEDCLLAALPTKG